MIALFIPDPDSFSITPLILICVYDVRLNINKKGYSSNFFNLYYYFCNNVANINLIRNIVAFFMKNLLKNKKIRETPFRTEVLEVFKASNKPLSAEQLEASLGKFDRITLYRTLKTFFDKGVIHEVLIAGESKKMALCSSDCNEENHIHHLEHLHFFCEECKDTFCLDIAKLPSINIPNHTINSFEIQAKGICKNCK